MNNQDLEKIIKNGIATIITTRYGYKSPSLTLENVDLSQKGLVKIKYSFEKFVYINTADICHIVSTEQKDMAKTNRRKKSKGE